MSHIRLDKEGMHNDQGKLIDLYIPRKCAVTNKVIHAQDYASVQVNVGEVDGNGRYTKKNTTFAFSGFIRKQGRADSSLEDLLAKAGQFPIKE